MKASQFLIVVSLLVLPPFPAVAFDPNSLTNLTVVHDGFCNPYQCVLVTKDAKEYLLVLEDGTDNIIFIFLKIGDELQLLWSRDGI